MPLYLAPYIGSGTRVDSWRPLGSHQPGWSAIRLLAEGETSQTARCLLWLPAADSNARLEKLADALDESVSLAAKGTVRTALRLPKVDAPTIDEMIAEILLFPPVNGWKPLFPNRAGKLEIILDRRVIWQQSVIRGGATATEDFSAALDTGKWEIGGGDWGDLVRNASNRGRATGTGADSAMRLITPAIGDDQYAQEEYYHADAGLEAAGTLVRMASGTDESAYLGMADEGAGAQPAVIFETNSLFSFSTLVDNATASYASGDTIRTEAEGTTIRFLKNGVQELTVTDATIASGQPGAYIFTDNLANCEIDNWEGGDLGAAPAAVVRMSGRIGRGIGYGFFVGR